MSEAAAPAEGEEDVFNFKDAKDVFLGHKQLIADMALVDGALYTAAQDGAQPQHSFLFVVVVFFFFSLFFCLVRLAHACAFGSGRIIAFDTYDRSKTDELRAADAVNCLAYAEPHLYCAVGNLVFMVKRGTGQSAAEPPRFFFLFFSFFFFFFFVTHGRGGSRPLAHCDV